MQRETTASAADGGRRLVGKRAVVTAAGQGIGRAIAERFAREGARVLAVDVDAAKLADLSGDRVEAACADASSEAAMTPMLRRFRPTVLANCVGWVHQGTVLDCSQDDWRRAFTLNVDSVYVAVRVVLPMMIEAGGGSIFNIASVAGQRAAASRAAYSATKAAVVGLTKSISADFAARGVRCNAICPAMVDTPSLAERIAGMPEPDAARALFVSRHPVGRLGRPEEVAALAAYLAADESAFMTGAALVLDGGAVA
jgi:2-keto-3-deoxy-L-fuconate dehydrogenase